MVFHWSLSDSKSPQVSRSRLRILAVLSNAVVLIVSTRPPTSKSFRPFNNPLVTVPNAPITIGTIVTFMFHSFYNSLARSRYLSFFSLSFRFILWSAGTAKSTILQILFSFSFLFFFFFFFFFVNYYEVWSSGRDLVISLYVKVPYEFMRFIITIIIIINLKLDNCLKKWLQHDITQQVKTYHKTDQTNQFLKYFLKTLEVIPNAMIMIAI